jgi:hypothetical protein
LQNDHSAFLEYSFPPNSLLEELAVGVSEFAPAVLLAVDPLSAVNFLGEVGEDSEAVFSAVLVVTVIAGAILPAEIPLSVHLALLPLALVVRSISEVSSPLSHWREGALAYCALVGPSVGVHDPTGAWEVVEMDGEGLGWVDQVGDAQFASFGEGVLHGAGELHSAVDAVQAALAVSASLPHLSLVDESLLQQLHCACATRHDLELAVVDVVVGLEHYSQTLRLASYVPFAQVILVQELVLHQSMVFQNNGEG